MPKMNPEIKALWTAKLRSGEIEQARHTLAEEFKEAMCCLGVLCEIQAPNRAWVRRFYDGNWNDAMRKTRLPIDLAAGLTDQDCDYLAELNDGWDHSWHGKRLTFPEIADLIDREF